MRYSGRKQLPAPERGAAPKTPVPAAAAFNTVRVADTSQWWQGKKGKGPKPLPKHTDLGYDVVAKTNIERGGVL